MLAQAAATRLEEQRITAIEDRLALELDLGRHHELVSELTGLVEEFPLHERLRGQLMLAPYRSGRAAEALRVYRQTRRLLIEKMGTEPRAELQRLQHAILTADAVLDPPAGSPPAPPTLPIRRPRLLPTDIADFTSRTEHVSLIRQRLTRAAADGAQLAVPASGHPRRTGAGTRVQRQPPARSRVAPSPDVPRLWGSNEGADTAYQWLDCHAAS